MPNKIQRARVSGVSIYRELVHMYHRPQENVVPVGISYSLSVPNCFNSLHFLSCDGFSMYMSLRSLFKGLAGYPRYECTKHRRSYPSATLDQQRLETLPGSKRLAGLRPEPPLICT